MATVNLKYFRWNQPNSGDLVMGIDATTPQTLTSSATSQAASFASKDDLTYVRIVSTGNVYVTFGVTPVVVSGSGTLILANTPEYFFLPKNYKVAVID